MHIRRSWVRRIILVLLCAWSTLVTYLCYQREVKNPQQEHILSAVEKIETVYVVKHAIATQKSPTAIETQVTYNNTPPEHGGIKRNSSKSHRQRERYKMVVGILTALRNPPTVLSLAKRLVHVTNMSDYKLLVLQSYSAAGEVETKLALENLGYTVFTMTSEYAELEPSRLRITWGDPPSRVKWRTNHGENTVVHVCACICVCMCSGGSRICRKGGLYDLGTQVRDGCWTSGMSPLPRKARKLSATTYIRNQWII